MIKREAVGWMKSGKFRVLFVFAAVCAFVTSHPLSASVEPLIMEISEVRAGMTGKARTVFSGSSVEEFDIEVLGVLRNWRPGGDLILVRASGQSIEDIGIAAGMSGTPVYVDGKLVGAIAYAWPFSKEPIAGVTPIGEMLEQALLSQEETGRGRNRFEWEDSEKPGGAFEEIDTPLLLSGFHPAVQGIIQAELSHYNLTVAQTGSGSEQDLEDGLVPGSALAAQFVTGDASASAIGTVTYSEGERVLGFGHGLFQAGAVEIPMSGAYIHAVLPSLSGSVKLGSASKMVGTIVGDGAAGVVGRIGPVPELVPVRVSVESDRLKTREFDFGIMRHSLLTPSLVGWSVSSAALTVGGSSGDMTIDVECQIELESAGGRTRKVELRDVFFTTNPAAEIARILGDPLRLVMRNRFETLDPKRVICTVSIEHERKTASIDEVYVSPQRAVPGDSIEVTVRLRPFRGELQLERFALRVPAACDSKRMKVRVCSAPGMRAWEEETTNRRLPPTNIEQLVSRIAGSGRGNRLECMAYVEEQEAGIEGRSFPSPPESFSSVVGAAGRAGSVATAHVGVLAHAERETGFVIRGCHTVEVEVDSDKSRRNQ